MYEAGYEAMYEARDPQHWNQKVEISMTSDRDGMPNDVRNSSEPSTSAPSFTEITSESTVSNEEQGMVALHIICCISNQRANRAREQHREVGKF